MLVAILCWSVIISKTAEEKLHLRHSHCPLQKRFGMEKNMQTYKLFMKLVKRNLPSVIVYAVIFIVIAVITSGNGSKEETMLYQNEEINFTVLNRDGSKTGDAIREYLDINNIYIEEPDDMAVLQEELFYRDIYYVLIIPEGFEAALLAGEYIPLENYKVKDSAMGYYLDLEVEGYLAVLRSYLATDMNLEESISRAAAAMEKDVAVEVQTESSKKIPPTVNYFQYLPYVYLAMLMSILGSILLLFNKEKVRLRSACSSLNIMKRNIQIAMGTVTVGFAIWLIFELIAAVLYGKNDSAFVLWGTGINSFCFVLLTVALSVMLGFLVKKPPVLSAIALIISLGMSFLGGIFVPLSVLGEGMKKIAKFMPTYWYVTANEALIGASEFTETYWLGVFIQLMFAAVFFSIAMVASKRLRYS